MGLALTAFSGSVNAIKQIDKLKKNIEQLNEKSTFDDIEKIVQEISKYKDKYKGNDTPLARITRHLAQKEATSIPYTPLAKNLHDCKSCLAVFIFNKIRYELDGCKKWKDIVKLDQLRKLMHKLIVSKFKFSLEESLDCFQKELAANLDNKIVNMSNKQINALKIVRKQDQTMHMIYKICKKIIIRSKKVNPAELNKFSSKEELIKIVENLFQLNLLLNYKNLLSSKCFKNCTDNEIIYDFVEGITTIKKLQDIKKALKKDKIIIIN